MQQLELFEIESPCVNICTSDARGFCSGCFRTRDERVYWYKVSNQVKRQIITACARRKKNAQASKKIIKTKNDKQLEMLLQDFHESSSHE